MGTDEHATSGARSAAYAYDGRAPGWRRPAGWTGDDWHPRLSALIEAGYIFLRQGFAAGGVLFRGMGAGLFEALAAQSFWQFPSDRPQAQLERALGVIFCSEHAGDALSAARPWQAAGAGAGLLVFGSDCYRQRYRQRAAAMLALADPGMVFKYPLLAEPLHWYDLDCILVDAHTLQRCTAAVAGEPAGLTDNTRRGLQRLAGAGLFDKLQAVAAPDRESWSEAVDVCLRRLRLEPASLDDS